MASILTNNRHVNKGLTPKLSRLKASLRRHRISIWEIAQACELTDAYVWMVLNGRRRSVKVLETASRLLSERQGKKP